MEKRIEFVIRAARGLERLKHLCREFHISRPTGYLWLRRYKEMGTIVGLKERSRRPHRSPAKISEQLERHVISLRLKWGWGAKKLRVLLKLGGIELPLSTINRVISRNGLIPPRSSHPHHFRRFERSKPNELWQMDFKGEFLQGKKRCYPLTIIDDHSRYLIGLYALPTMKGEVVRRCLVQAFRENGLPDRLLVDHGSPWWGTGGELGLSKLAVAILRTGVKIAYSGFNHPQTQGKVERFHRTLEEEVQRRGFPPTYEGWKSLLSRIRYDYNHIRPHEALDFKTPAEVYRKSEKPYRGAVPWLYSSDLAVTKVYETGAIYFHGKHFFVSNALPGERVGIKRSGNKLFVYFQHLLIREINIATRHGVQIASSPYCKGCPETQCKA